MATGAKAKMAVGAKKTGNVVVWVVLGLLVFALAGFGATGFTGTLRTLGRVGEVQIDAEDYMRSLNIQLQIDDQTGKSVAWEDVQERGVDRDVLERLVESAALKNETYELGISVGDGHVRQRIIDLPSFQSLDGKFSAKEYHDRLRDNGLNAREFENDLRTERAQQLLRDAMRAAVRMPSKMSDAIVIHERERRSFTWAPVDEAALDEQPAEPTDEEIEAYHEENSDDFMLPESRKITFAVLIPDMILDTTEVEESEVETLYESKADEYDVAERRLVERLVFSAEDSARAALDRVEAGEITFEELVAERGLEMEDVELGEVTVEELGDVGEEVFDEDIEAGSVAGPFETDLGFALYNVGGVIEAQFTPLEEVEEELRDELARQRATRAIEGMAEDVEDLLAGGATLEELAEETDMVVSTIDWNVDGSGDSEVDPESGIPDIAAYEEFRDLAAAVDEDDYPEVGFLNDGGIFAIRLESVTPPRVEPLEDAREAVLEAMRAERLREALEARAEELAAAIADGSALELGSDMAADESEGEGDSETAEGADEDSGESEDTAEDTAENAEEDAAEDPEAAHYADFTALGLEAKVENGLLRGAFIEGAPEEFMDAAFALKPGEVDVVSDDEIVAIVRLDEALPPEEGSQLEFRHENTVRQMSSGLASDLYEAYTTNVVENADRRIDEQALETVSNFTAQQYSGN